MKVTICDCCKCRPSKGAFVMDADGIHPPEPRPRQEGFRPVATTDLCESCSVSLQFHWAANAGTPP